MILQINHQASYHIGFFHRSQFVEELFKPQEMCSEMATRELFYKV